MSYSLLIAIRALAQMGFEPTVRERPLSDGETEVRCRDQSAVLSWAAADGAITLRGRDVIPLRIVPLFSAITRLDVEPLRELIADADADSGDSVTLVLYPTPSSASDYGRLEPNCHAVFTHSHMRSPTEDDDALVSSPCHPGTSAAWSGWHDSSAGSRWLRDFSFTHQRSAACPCRRLSELLGLTVASTACASFAPRSITRRSESTVT